MDLGQVNRDRRYKRRKCPNGDDGGQQRRNIRKQVL